MNIREVLKLKDGTEVKIAGWNNNTWVVINNYTLVLKGKGVNIEDQYTLEFIVNAEFELYYEPITISEVLCKDRVGHIIKMLGDDSRVYKVIECNGKFDLEFIGSPMRVSDEYFLSEVLTSMYIDRGECDEDEVEE